MNICNIEMLLSFISVINELRQRDHRLMESLYVAFLISPAVKWRRRHHTCRKLYVWHKSDSCDNIKLFFNLSLERLFTHTHTWALHLSQIGKIDEDFWLKSVLFILLISYANSVTQTNFFPTKRQEKKNPHGSPITFCGIFTLDSVTWQLEAVTHPISDIHTILELCLEIISSNLILPLSRDAVSPLHWCSCHR